MERYMDNSKVRKTMIPEIHVEEIRVKRMKDEEKERFLKDSSQITARYYVGLKKQEVYTVRKDHLKKWTWLYIFTNQEGALIGYNALTRVKVLRNRVIFDNCGYICEGFREKGLMTGIIMNLLLRELIKRIWMPIYFSMRTSNPFLYELVHKKLRTFPDFNGGPPPKDIQNLATQIVKEAYDMQLSFDPIKMTVEGGYVEDFVVDFNDVQKAKNERINDFFRNNLKYGQRGGNRFLLLAKVSIKDIPTYLRLAKKRHSRKKGNT